MNRKLQNISIDITGRNYQLDKTQIAAKGHSKLCITVRSNGTISVSVCLSVYPEIHVKLAGE